MSTTTTIQPEKLGREELIRQVRTLRDARAILRQRGACIDVLDAIEWLAADARDELSRLQALNVAEAGE